MAGWRVSSALGQTRPVPPTWYRPGVQGPGPPSPRDRALGRAALALLAGVGFTLLGGPGTGLTVLLIGLVPVPLAGLEAWAERDRDSLRRALVAATVAWLATALGLALGDLQFVSTAALVSGKGFAGSLEAIQRELDWLTSPEPSMPKPMQMSPMVVVFAGGFLASGSAAATAARVSRSPIAASTAALVLGAVLTEAVSLGWLFAFTAGKPSYPGGPPATGPGLGAIPMHFLCTGACTVPAAGGAALALALGDAIGKRLGPELARRLRPRDEASADGGGAGA